MIPLWQILIGPLATESFRKIVVELRKRGKNPHKEAIDKIFERNKTLKGQAKVKDAIKSALEKNVENKLSPKEVKERFRYLSREISSEDERIIDLACREIREKLLIALKSLEDPSYEILRILTEIHLPEIENILKKDEITKPKLFREIPAWIDFEEGFFVKREKQAQRIFERLKIHNIHVVHGVPTSGKSNFVKYLGYKLAKKNYCVFYIGLKEHMIGRLFEDIKKIIGREECILIIDDNHLDLKNEMQTLMDITKNKALKIIISTRPLSEELYTHTKDRVQEYIKGEEYSTRLVPKEIIGELIEKYSEKII